MAKESTTKKPLHCAISAFKIENDKMHKAFGNSAGHVAHLKEEMNN